MCDNGECIAPVAICNARADCSDRSDEKDCDKVCSVMFSECLTFFSLQDCSNYYVMDDVLSSKINSIYFVTVLYIELWVPSCK